MSTIADDQSCNYGGTLRTKQESGAVKSNWISQFSNSNHFLFALVACLLAPFWPSMKFTTSSVVTVMVLTVAKYDRRKFGY